MGKSIIALGAILTVYTIVAMTFELPQLSDLFPVGMFPSEDDKYHKIVPSDEASCINHYVVGTGILLMVIGFLIEKSKARND